MRGARLRAAAAAIAVICVLPAVRLAGLARLEQRAGASAEAAGDLLLAQAHYERSARCGFAFNVWAERSIDGLLRIAAVRIAAGDLPGALAAAESARGILVAQGGRGPLQGRAREAADIAATARARLAGQLATGETDPARITASFACWREPRPLPALAGLGLLAAAAASAILAALGWARPQGAAAGARWCASCVALLLAALALWFVA